MRIAPPWLDYALLDCSGGERLERWGAYTLIRPDPQVIWQTPKDARWNAADAHYLRSSSGGGHWEYARKLPESWQLRWNELRFLVRPTGFKHTGLFPEQAVNWLFLQERVRAFRTRYDRAPRVLNLFAYTGAATAACLSAGASVCHVDAAKGMVSWARENAAASGLSGAPARWLIDDCGKFLQREARRGSFYDGILMDPPSYGRGPGGEVWKLEECLFALAKDAAALLSPEADFFLLSGYTAGLSPAVMGCVLRLATAGRGGRVSADEIGLPVEGSALVLPCGGTAIWEGGESL